MFSSTPAFATATATTTEPTAKYNAHALIADIGIKAATEAIRDSNKHITITALNINDSRLAHSPPETGRTITDLLNDLTGLETVNLQNNVFGFNITNPGIFADVLHATKARVTLSESDIDKLNDDEKVHLGKAIANKTGAPSEIVLNTSKEPVALDPELPCTFEALKETQPIMYQSAVRERTLGEKHLIKQSSAPQGKATQYGGWRGSILAKTRWATHR